MSKKTKPDSVTTICQRAGCFSEFSSRIGKTGKPQKVYCSEECRKLAYQMRKTLTVTCPYCGETSTHSQAEVLAANNLKPKKGSSNVNQAERQKAGKVDPICGLE